MWRGKCFFSFFLLKLRGVVILFNENFVGRVFRKNKDFYGNYFMLEFIIWGKNFFFCSLYGLNKDNLVFMKNLRKILRGLIVKEL